MTERCFTAADVRAIVERYEADEDRGVRVNALAAAMAEQEGVCPPLEVCNGVCLRCGSGVLSSGEHIRDDLAPCYGRPYGGQ